MNLANCLCYLCIMVTRNESKASNLLQCFYFMSNWVYMLTDLVDSFLNAIPNLYSFYSVLLSLNHNSSCYDSRRRSAVTRFLVCSLRGIQNKLSSDRVESTESESLDILSNSDAIFGDNRFRSSLKLVLQLHIRSPGVNSHVSPRRTKSKRNSLC